MREFNISVSKCNECPFIDKYVNATYCSHTVAMRAGDVVRLRFAELNRDGITPSCPMYSESVEVDG